MCYIVLDIFEGEYIQMEIVLNKEKKTVPLCLYGKLNICYFSDKKDTCIERYEFIPMSKEKYKATYLGAV